MNTENSNENLNDALNSANLGDRMWLFFSKYSQLLLSMAAVFGLILILILVIMAGRTICRWSMELAYSNAIHSGNREHFAQKYVSDQLGGIVYLGLGDEAYVEKEYKKAAQYYHLARIGLGESIFGGRAMIGESIALMHLGLIPEGEEILKKVTEEKYPSHVYGNAMYLLATNAADNGERRRAREWLSKIVNGDFFQPFKEQSQRLFSQL
jgi:hypothetical protein